MFGSQKNIPSKHILNDKKYDDNYHTEAWNKSQPFYVMFVWNSCGHCHDILPMWQALTKSNINKDTQLFQIEMNDKDAFAKMLGGIPAVNAITGFPTFMKLQKGKAPEQYTGNRTTDSFVKWITGQKGGRRKTRRKRRRTRHR